MRRYRPVSGPWVEYHASGLWDEAWRRTEFSPETTIDGVLHLCAEPEMIWTIDSTVGLKLEVPGHKKPVRKCEHCGRADWVDDPAYSVDEAIERGWLIPVERIEDA